MSSEQLESRLIDLEIRFAHQQNHIDELDKVIYQQQQLIDRLQEKVVLLEKRLKTMGESNILRPEEDRPPPHY
ncbi:MAG: SlyX family protein [Gammaproteobacteria bacterium]|nr:MAG: SlyX family protein [Gammaproteobacteria bacterium]